MYGTSSSVLPHYNNNNSNNNAAIHHVTSLGHTTFCETAIGATTNGLSAMSIAAQKADTSVVGQSISYTLSRQNVPRQNVDYSPDSYYVSFKLKNSNPMIPRHAPDLKSHFCVTNFCPLIQISKLSPLD